MKAMKTCKMGCGKMKSGGPVIKKVKKMAKGGQIYGIPQTGTTNYSAPTMKTGGATSKTKKFAALAPPYDKATFADKIAGAKKKVKLTKKQFGGTPTPTNPVPTRTLENLAMFIGGGLGTALAARKQNQPMSQKKKERVLARQQKKAARKSK